MSRRSGRSRAWHGTRRCRERGPTPRAAWIAAVSACLLAASHCPAQDASAPGLTVWAWDLGERLPRFPTVADGQTPNAYFIAPTLEFDESITGAYGDLKDRFAGRAWGWLRIDEPGEYAFRLECDDGARLVIDGVTVLDTAWGEGFRVEGVAALDTGVRAIDVPFYEDEGRFRLRLLWKPPGSNRFAPIPTERLRTQGGQTFATSPGVKRFSFGEDDRAPGDGREPAGVHPWFTLDTFRPEAFRPAVGGLAFLPDGRLAVCTWDHDGGVYIIDASGRDRGEEASVSMFARGLGEPLGLCVLDGDIYVAQKQEVTRLRDTDGDGRADIYECVAGGWAASHNYHEFTFNLVWLDGAFYTCTSVPLRGGWTNYTPGSEPAFAVGPGPGSVLRIDPRTGHFEVFASGLRAPNGLAIGTDGELFGCDNQGAWLPCSRFNHIRRGGFYGHQTEPDGTTPGEPPVAWMPHNEVSNSPSQPALVPDGPYVGQMLVGDVTHGGIKRLFVEKIGGQAGRYQAALFRFSQGLEAGVNRLAFGPDGSLYVGGIGSNGNWHHNNTRFGLQRLIPGGPVPFEILRVQSRRGGFLLTFTAPVPGALLADPARYEALQWRYQPTIEYGGPKLDLHRLRVAGATPSADRRQVYLEIPGLRAGHVVYLRMLGMTDDAGRSPWTTECWYTLNAISDEPGPGFDDGARRPDLPRVPPPGAVVLFAGADASRLRMKSDGAPVRWRIEHGELVVDRSAGDVVSRQAFGDGWLHVEWLSPPGGDPATQQNGNSGVKLQARYEVQILNTPRAPHPPRFNEAGSIYRVHPADVNASTGPGTWQTYDVFFTAPRWDGDGPGARKTASARMTVVWNGVIVHDDAEVPRQTGVSEPEMPGDHPILVQAHPSGAVGDVRFRNIWFVPGVTRPPGP